MQTNFGAGYLFGVDSTGNPVMFGALQDANADFSGDLKMMYGQGQYALDQARGKSKIDVKATFGFIDPVLFNSLYFGGSIATGAVRMALGESGTIPASSTYVVTVVNAAAFVDNYGVVDMTTGKFMKKVASGPTAGQYTVAAGVYTFAAADASKAVKIYYTWTDTSNGYKITGGNPNMGIVPYFSVLLSNPSRQGNSTTLKLYKCVSSKLSFPAKLDDFTYPDLSMSAQDDGLGNVFDYSAYG